MHVQYCEVHKSRRCKPSACEHVRLYHWHVVQDEYEKTCEECGEAFNAKRHHARYCGAACRKQSSRHTSRL